MEPTSQRKNLLFDEIPAGTPALYHYTDAGGLIGMVEHKKLWLTNIHYLNDDKEFYHAIDLAEEVLKEEYPGLFAKSGGVFKSLMETMSPIFCFSLSEEEDSLSQWRGYTPNGGYAISFQEQMLNATIKKEGLLIGQCLYNKDEQVKAIIDNVIGFTPEEYKRASVTRGEDTYLIKRINNLRYYIVQNMMRIAPLLKHSSFKDEKEWRLIKDMSKKGGGNYESPETMVLTPDSGSFKIRARRNLLIPYVEVPFNFEAGLITNFSQVVVGPTPHKKLAAEACRILLSNNLSLFNAASLIRNSEIPYVNW